jgi:formylmethanofuran dehydrogenase subunit B
VTPGLVNGRPCSLDEATEAAVALLAAARLPLVYGLSDSTVEAQREAVRIARDLRGVIDSATSSAGVAAHDAFTRLGLLTTSLGEMARRADLVVFWGCDPEDSQPGFTLRHAPARAGRWRVAVDVGEAQAGPPADERLAVPAAREIETLLVLRALLRGRRVETARVESLGLSLESLRGLAQRLADCAYGVLVHDGNPPPARREPLRPAALTALVQGRRGRGRLRTLALQGAGNPVGAESVLTWQTGFPFAVSFTRGYPRHDPHALTAEGLLARGEVDAALLVGADPSQYLSPRALGHLREIPRVAVGEGEATSVLIRAAPFTATAGRVFRMDGLAVRQEPAEVSALPSEAAVLLRIGRALRNRGAHGEA